MTARATDDVQPANAVLTHVANVIGRIGGSCGLLVILDPPLNLHAPATAVAPRLDRSRIERQRSTTSTPRRWMKGGGGEAQEGVNFVSTSLRPRARRALRT
jgi:hypothetical protein